MNAVEALQEWKMNAIEFGTLQIGVDAQLAQGNGDVSVIAEFDSIDTYRSYAEDPRHQQVIREHIRPILADRAAIQYEI